MTSTTASPQFTDAMTPSQTIGPLYGFCLLFPGSENTIEPSDPDAVRISGCVYDGKGVPVEYPECLLEIWDGEQYARTRTDAEGRWHALVRKPSSRRLPDGRVAAPHLKVAVFARGLLKQAQTLMYFPDEAEANAADPIMELVPQDRQSRLVARGNGSELRYDIYLQGPVESVFFDY